MVDDCNIGRMEYTAYKILAKCHITHGVWCGGLWTVWNEWNEWRANLVPFIICNDLR